MQRDFVLIEGSIQGTITFKWDPLGCEVIADSITLENEYGTVSVQRGPTQFQRDLFNAIETECLKNFADDQDMIAFWHRAAMKEDGHRVRWRMEA